MLLIRSSNVNVHTYRSTKFYIVTQANEIVCCVNIGIVPFIHLLDVSITPTPTVIENATCSLQLYPAFSSYLYIVYGIPTKMIIFHVVYVVVTWIDLCFERVLTNIQLHMWWLNCHFSWMLVILLASITRTIHWII